MALSRHLSLQGLCVLLLGTMVGGQGKGCPSVLGPQQGVDALVKGKVSGVLQPSLSVFDQKAATVTEYWSLSYGGSAGHSGRFYRAVRFALNRAGSAWDPPLSPFSQGASRSPCGSRCVESPATELSWDSGLFSQAPCAWCVSTAPGSLCFRCLCSCSLCVYVWLCVCVCV